MKKLSLVLVLALFCVSAMIAQRNITGTVTDEGGEALIGVSILAKNTSTGTVTDIDGTYSLRVPEGTTTLVFSYTGFGTKEVALGASNVVDVSLKEAAEQLSEVVVTGLGIRKEKKALGYGVVTLDQSQLELKPEADVARVLRGKVPGVDILSTSGLAGSGTNVIIRGYSSITGTNQPLFVVDGVPFGSETDPDRTANAGNAAASSRFLDLDPNNIAEVSVLKGLSATVLYGEAGRNGVILITTKNGASRDLNKKFEVTVDQSLFANQIASLPDDQDAYGNGFNNSASAAFSNWGAPFDQPGKNGLAADGTIAHPYSRSNLNAVFPQYVGARYQYKAYDNLQNFFETGLISNTSVSVAHRLSEGTSINFSYGYRSEEGFIPLSTFDKNTFGLGINTRLDNGIGIRTTFNYVRSDRTAPPAGISTSSNPDAGAASLFSNVFYTPRSVSLFDLEYENPLTNESIYYRGGNDIQHPLWTLNNTADNEKVNRFFGSASFDYAITDWLTVNYRYGLDTYTQNQRYSINKGGRQVPNGALFTSERLNVIHDHNLNFSFNRDLNEDFNLDGVVGVNVRGDIRERTGTGSTQQFVYGLLTHDNYIVHNNFSDKREESLIGAYISAAIGYRSFLYLNLQGRNDWTSTLEKDNRSVVYPSASVSFIPTEAFTSMQGGFFDYLKLRLGYGTSAGYPSPYRTRNILGINANEFVTNGGTVINTNSVDDLFGNPALQPEVHKELEFGLEARMLKNRVGIDLSLYQKKSSDLIIDLPLDPSTGYGTTTINAASINNKGSELGVDFTPVSTKDWRVTLNGNITRNIGTVDELADGIDQFPILEIYTTLGSYAIPGEPYGIIQGGRVSRDDNGNMIVAPGGTYLLDPELGQLGNPNPDYNLNGSLNVSYKGITLSALLTYQHGGVIYATTPSTMMGRGILQETDFDRFVPVIAPGVQADGTPNTVQTDPTTHYWENGGVFVDEMRVYDASFVKLREISISFNMPKSALENTPFGSASLTFSGQNVWFKALGFPAGANFDPEVLSTGVGNTRGFELMNVPTGKQMGGSLRLTF